MIERIKAINNPLTIIAIFAALAEVAGTVAIATVEKEIQHIFVWFVMAFPTLLVTLFFVTLNFNAKVLYAPSDFRNEENFLATLAGTRALSVDLAALTRELDAAKAEIVKQATEQVSSIGESERNKLVSVVREQMERLQARVEITQSAADVVADAAHSAIPARVNSKALEGKILNSLSCDTANALSIRDLVKATEANAWYVRHALAGLEERAMITRVGPQGDEKFVLAPGRFRIPPPATDREP